MRFGPLLLSGLVAFGQPAAAFDVNDARRQFVASNMIATFYHELGHAFVDLLEIPVLGREEDAVDALSTLLIDFLWDPEDAEILIAEVAYGYALHVAHTDDLPDAAWWANHSLDLQRMAAVVCQFYGQDPDERYELAIDLGMPPEMSDRCIMTAQQVMGSWAMFLEELEDAPRRFGLRLVEPVVDEWLAEVVMEELVLLNTHFGLPDWVDVSIEACGQANAFYSPSERRIIMCTEFADWYAALWDADNL
jgi:hypothetical protein